jgi:hypothetical protein
MFRFFLRTPFQPGYAQTTSKIIFGQQSVSASYSISSVTLSDTAHELLKEAAALENKMAIKRAQQIYKKIIFDVDPSCAIAYEKLWNSWMHHNIQTGFGLEDEQRTAFFNNYEKFILKNNNHPFLNENNDASQPRMLKK